MNFLKSLLQAFASNYRAAKRKHAGCNCGWYGPRCGCPLDHR